MGQVHPRPFQWSNYLVGSWKPVLGPSQPAQLETAPLLLETSSLAAGAFRSSPIPPLHSKGEPQPMLDLITGGALGLPTVGRWACPRHFPAIMASTVLVVASSAQGSALAWCPVALGVAFLREAPVAEAASDKAAVDAGASEGLGVADGP